MQAAGGPSRAALVSRVQSPWGVSNKNEALKDRVEARRHELLAKYNDLKADTRAESARAAAKIKYRLDELEAHLKVGWDRMSDAMRAKIDKWLDDKD
jgi:hypothetical protein